MSKILLSIIIAIILITIGATAFLINHTNRIKMEHNQAQDMIWSADQQKALILADRELEIHFPGKMNSGVVYKPTNIMAQEKPASNLDAIYIVTYDLPGGLTDQGVWITVDITAGKVISFEKAQA